MAELIGSRRMGSSSTLHLSFRDHVHKFNPGQKDPGTAKILEAPHGPGTSFDRPRVLLDDVVELLTLANLDGRLTIGIDRFERGEIGTAYVDRHNIGHTVPPDFEIAFCRHFFEASQAKQVCHVPPHAQQDHIQWIAQSLQHESW